MKASVETLSPTRVKLNVEVPFEELAPSIDTAYKRISRQVKVQGFRPGKVPPRILDQRVGRGVVLEEALNDALPRLYREAVDENQVAAIGQPEVDLTSFADGQPLTFTATVDVRPDIELPPYEGLPVVVDAVAVPDEEVDAQLGSLRDRFASLKTVERPAATGDYVLLDIRATTPDGEPIEGSEATGLSYEVGSDSLITGVDEAVTGAAAGDERTFTAEIQYGVHAGTTATFHVTVTAVKEKDLPALDDEFARTASEFETIAELRDDVRTRMERIRRLEQGVQARDRVLEVLLERTTVPMPESMVEAETSWRLRRMEEQVAEAGMDMDAFLADSGQTREELEADARSGAEQAVQAQLVLDAIGIKEELGVSETELTDQVVRRAQRAGLSPDDLAQRLVRQGQLPALMAEIVRGKALAMVLEAATVTDSNGAPVDLSDLRDDAQSTSLLEATLDEVAAEGHEDHDHDHEGHDHAH
ncbi:MAG TPA: trigger factor [Mycobacteriales bacterium]|nr:trigger factor [Mycobacteriales bacterium]